MAKLTDIYSVIEGAHFMDADGLTHYHAARATRDAMRCHSVEISLAKIKHALNAYRVTVALALRESDMQYGVRISNRVTGKEIIL
jgi:hypothetical protein